MTLSVEPDDYRHAAELLRGLSKRRELREVETGPIELAADICDHVARDLQFAHDAAAGQRPQPKSWQAPAGLLENEARKRAHIIKTCKLADTTIAQLHMVENGTGLVMPAALFRELGRSAALLNLLCLWLGGEPPAADAKSKALELPKDSST